MLAGGEIFRLIEQEQQREAVKLLETSLRVSICLLSLPVFICCGRRLTTIDDSGLLHVSAGQACDDLCVIWR